MARRKKIEQEEPKYSEPLQYEKDCKHVHGYKDGRNGKTLDAAQKEIAKLKKQGYELSTSQKMFNTKHEVIGMDYLLCRNK